MQTMYHSFQQCLSALLQPPPAQHQPMQTPPSSPVPIHHQIPGPVPPCCAGRPAAGTNVPQRLCIPTPVATQHPLLLPRREGSCLVGSSQLPACSMGLVVVGVLRGEFVLPSKRPSSEQSPGHLETVGGSKTWPSAVCCFFL